MRVRRPLQPPPVWPLVAATPRLRASPPDSNALPAKRTGQDIYNAACITCHGPDGTGSPQSVVGFDAELPDFTDCAFAAGEADPDWYSVVHEGSPIRGLGHHMPAFGEALSNDDIELAVSHVRTFCANPAWPRGDLNLPRAFFTEKAFPENEAVWSTALACVATTGSMANKFIYERRFGPRDPVEVNVPVDLQNGRRRRGRGARATSPSRFKRVALRQHGDRAHRRGRRGS